MSDRHVRPSPRHFAKQVPIQPSGTWLSLAKARAIGRLGTLGGRDGVAFRGVARPICARPRRKAGSRPARTRRDSLPSPSRVPPVLRAELRRRTPGFAAARAGSARRAPGGVAAVQRPRVASSVARREWTGNSPRIHSWPWSARRSRGGHGFAAARHSEIRARTARPVGGCAASHGCGPVDEARCAQPSVGGSAPLGRQ